MKALARAIASPELVEGQLGIVPAPIGKQFPVLCAPPLPPAQHRPGRGAWRQLPARRGCDQHRPGPGLPLDSLGIDCALASYGVFGFDLAHRPATIATLKVNDIAIARGPVSFGEAGHVSVSIRASTGTSSSCAAGIRARPRALRATRRKDCAACYTPAKTIVHGLLVLMIRPVGVNIPFAWSIPNGTIVSVFCCSLNPSSAFAA